jgi:ketosteroid isomerase-like protein
MSDVARTIQAYFDGINGERYDEVAALFAPDGVIEAPGTEPRRGAEEIERYFEAALRLYPEHLDDPTRTIEAGTTVTVEIHFTGALASGARIEFDAVDVFDLDDQARIVRLTSWYDSHAVREQLRSAREADRAGGRA